jgi:hypothetical protein
MNITEFTPFIYTEQKGGIWHSFFAVKLDALSVFDSSQGKYKDFAFELLNRQIDFINTLDCPEDNRVINLRFICHPDASFYRKGRIDIVLIVRIPDNDKERSVENAVKAFKDIWTGLITLSEHYEFAPVVDKNEFQHLLDPFPVESIAEITRREDIVEIETARRVRGFNYNETAFSEEQKNIYYVYPFIWSLNSLSRTCKSLLLQPRPSVISITLRPIAFSDEIAGKYHRMIELIESNFASNKINSRTKSILKNINSQLIRIEDSPFYVKILIASNGPISKGLIDSFGVDITEHAGSPDIIEDVNDDYVFSGGYDWHSFDSSNKEKVVDDLRWLDISFSAPTIAPQNYKDIRYLYDSTQANTVFRLPVPQTKEIPGIRTNFFKNVHPPSNVSGEGLLIGYNKKESLTQDVGMLREDRRKHMYITGQTGTGKSTLLLNMILQDIENNEGVAVLDPHGELVDDILGRIPGRRMKDVIYINFEDTERPISINMLECRTELEKDLSVQLLFEIFERLYDLRATGGPIFELYMQNALYLIMDDPDEAPTVLDVHKVFAEKRFREYKLSKASNPYIISFWKRVAEEAGGEAALRNIAPYIISKMNRFIYNKTLRNIIAPAKSAVNFRQVIDEGKVLLVDMCKGKFGKINSHFLGMIIISKIFINALGRGDTGDKKRLKDFYLYVDEFQNLATDSFIDILSEARKYRLNAILANQYLTQLPEYVLNAIFGNVGASLAFRLGIKDAEIMEQEFHPSFTRNDLSNMPNWSLAVNLIHKGEVLPPFSMNTFPVADSFDLSSANKIKELSRSRYGRDIDDIESEINKRYGMKKDS